MPASSEHRILNKTQAVALLVALSAVSAGAAWLTVRWIESRTQELLDAPDWMIESVRTDVAAYVETLAWILAGPLLGVAAFTAWYAYRGLRTQTLPPAGSWIVEGQRVRRGTDAARASRWLLALAAFMAMAATMLFALVHRLAGQL